MNIQRCTASHFVTATSLLLMTVQAHAVTQEPEQLATVGPIGGIIFGVLFVGFCVGVVWMMIKQNKPGEQDKK